MEKWFENNLKKIMEHNEYTPEMITVVECDKKNKWTPIDLIMREYYNNGGMSAKGFLGLTTNSCIKMAYYIIEHQEEFKEKDMYNEEGISNSGFSLWENYILD